MPTPDELELAKQLSDVQRQLAILFEGLLLQRDHESRLSHYCERVRSNLQTVIDELR